MKQSRLLTNILLVVVAILAAANLVGQSVGTFIPAVGITISDTNSSGSFRIYRLFEDGRIERNRWSSQICNGWCGWEDVPEDYM